MNLYESFLKLNKKDVLYYNQNYSLKDFVKKPTNKEAEKFIKNFFDYGSKIRVFDLGFSKKLHKTGKHIHTVSLYLLGFQLKEIFEKKIKEHIVAITNKNFEFEFEYTWFLTCLYHDTASVIEKNSNIAECFYGSENEYLDYYLRKVDPDFSFDLYRHNWSVPDQAHYTYTKELVENYFYYRHEHHNSNDHGIIGGFIYFDKLLKNYNSNWEKVKDEGRQYELFYTFKDGRCLRWQIEHLDHFAYIANSIIAHNIFHVTLNSNFNTIKMYDQYNLNEINSTIMDCRLKFENDPLTFFLGIMDTIEPIKSFTYNVSRPNFYTYLKILKKYTAYVENNKIVIMVDKSLFGETNTCKRCWENKILSLQEWLSVIVNIDDNKVEISF